MKDKMRAKSRPKVKRKKAEVASLESENAYYKWLYTSELIYLLRSLGIKAANVRGVTTWDIFASFRSKNT